MLERSPIEGVADAAPGGYPSRAVVFVTLLAALLFLPIILLLLAVRFVIRCLIAPQAACAELEPNRMVLARATVRRRTRRNTGSMPTFVLEPIEATTRRSRIECAFRNATGFLAMLFQNLDFSSDAGGFGRGRGGVSSVCVKWIGETRSASRFPGG